MSHVYYCTVQLRSVPLDYCCFNGCTEAGENDNAKRGRCDDGGGNVVATFARCGLEHL